MFLKSYQYLFLTTLIFGTLVAVSANSWFTCWLGLEINLMSMVPLMLINLKKPLTEAAIKYFLIQAMASTLMIISVTINLISSQYLMLEAVETLLLISLLMKAGTPPLHFWFPNIALKLNWFQCMILFTWQKVAPLLLLLSIKINKILVITALAATVGAIGGLNQLIMKSLMAYSSISHTGWVILAAYVNSSTWLLYFSIYCTMSICIIFVLNLSSVVSFTDISSWNSPALTKTMLIFNMLSLAGLPPFLGFLAKLSVLVFFISTGLTFLMLLLVMMSLVSLYYYARITYSAMMLKQPNKFLTLSPLNSSFVSLTLCSTANILGPLILTMI